jgi:hypothetical protein
MQPEHKPRDRLIPLDFRPQMTHAPIESALVGKILTSPTRLKAASMVKSATESYRDSP